MPASNEKILVGLVGPEVLSAIEADATHPVSIDIGACNALEIRYDFFPEKEWPALSKRVRKIAPHAMQVGTIRLERDGGRFPDRDAYSRIPLWSKILAEGDVPEWLDLEQDCLYDFKNLKNLADLRKTKVLVSQHNFLRIPSQQELDDFARDCLRVKADGLKIAAMSNGETDCERLYKFARIHSQNFELFAAFGMGETGKASRVWSLKEGANLTYGSIGQAQAPGQVDVLKMARALRELPGLTTPADVLNSFAKL
ncbi:3-dehydroquinate dehydratase [Fibrobacter sp. UWT3]|uniref:type I 3-dehydroquinate dehydratase n=1 Tax=Fibrobacter sp. UWT3 TaxID=1896225 RepID=UPI000BDB8FB3|nr:type I 3-dehydroquinate dehydratase [Fibrobacter sp. UWT3]SOE75326.1 3-dehydroquinate dehydratase [Fibrobacter sp. UWT3]